MFIKLTIGWLDFENDIRKRVLVRVDKIKCIEDTESGSIIAFDDDSYLNVAERASDIQMIILEEIQRMERMKQ